MPARPIAWSRTPTPTTCPTALEREFGSDPLDANSPSCGPLDFSEFRVIGNGTTNVGYDAGARRSRARHHARTGCGRPRSASCTRSTARATLTDPLLVTRVRDNDPFRIDIHARSIDGKLYRLRYEGYGRVNRMTKRRLRRSLGDHFTGERYELIGIDVAAEIARMDPGAVFATIERISVRGSFVMQQPAVLSTGMIGRRSRTH